MTAPLRSVPRPDPRRAPVPRMIAALLITLAVAACTGPSGIGGGSPNVRTAGGGGGGGGGMSY